MNIRGEEDERSVKLDISMELTEFPSNKEKLAVENRTYMAASESSDYLNLSGLNAFANHQLGPENIPCNFTSVEQLVTSSEENVYEDYNPAYSTESVPDDDSYAEIKDNSATNNAAVQNNCSNNVPACGIVPVAQQRNESDILLLEDESLCIFKRLVLGKQIHSFRKYSSYTVGSIYKEVEGFILLDVFYIISGLCILSLGAGNLCQCPVSLSLPFLVILYGIFAVFSGAVIIYLQFQKIESSRVCNSFLMIYRLFRLCMMVIGLLGIIEVYGKFKPDEDPRSKSYCSPPVYWSAVTVFTTTVGVIIVVIVLMLIGVVRYFM